MQPNNNREEMGKVMNIPIKEQIAEMIHEEMDEGEEELLKDSSEIVKKLDTFIEYSINRTLDKIKNSGKDNHEIGGREASKEKEAKTEQE